VASLVTANNEHYISNIKRNIIIGFLTVAIVVPFVWMLMDRDPPYERFAGEIIAADPSECGITPINPAGGAPRSVFTPIRAGGCVEVKWDIKVARDCPAAPSGDNVARHLRDSLGITKPIGSLHRNEPEPPSTEVRQFLTLPLPMPAGPATYTSIACFACNPLQHLFWPICVDKPDINFEVIK